jgi:hypothetical protein
MPEQETDATAFGFCDVSQEFREFISFGWSLRKLRRSARPRRMLYARRGLAAVEKLSTRLPGEPRKVTSGTPLPVTVVSSNQLSNEIPFHEPAER